MRPEELGAVYPHRWSIPRDVWTQFFNSAEHNISVLVYSALFLAEDYGLLDIMRPRGPMASAYGSRSAILRAYLLPNGGQEEGIGGAMPAKIRNARGVDGSRLVPPSKRPRSGHLP